MKHPGVAVRLYYSLRFSGLLRLSALYFTSANCDTNFWHTLKRRMRMIRLKRLFLSAILVGAMTDAFLRASAVKLGWLLPFVVSLGVLDALLSAASATNRFPRSLGGWRWPFAAAAAALAVAGVLAYLSTKGQPDALLRKEVTALAFDTFIVCLAAARLSAERHR